uniref:Uncharacterized protein n=1 Tax=Panagrolaimus sp. PS1159 TaxID=55785 RepID=A0AC35FYA6_9BILA
MATRAALNPSSLEEQIQQRINSMQNGKVRKDSQQPSHPRTCLTTTNPAAMPPPSTTNEINADADNNNADEEGILQQPSTSETPATQDINNPEDSIDNKKLKHRSLSNEKRPGSSGSHASKAKSNSYSNSDRPMSLKNLQEMALTTFCRENWIENAYEEVEVELQRDPQTGLGITVAGYVHKKGKLFYHKNI